MPDPTTPSSANLSRRTVAKGAMWASPTLVLANPAPASAASGRCWYNVTWTANATQGAKTLTATSTGSSQAYTVAFTSVITSGNPTDRNMTVGRRGRDGNSRNCSVTLIQCGEVNSSCDNVFNPGGLVLNHTGYPTNGATSGCSSVVPSQTLSWTIRNAAGETVTPAAARLSVTDMSAVGSNNVTGPWGYYWDQITFNAPAVLTADGVAGPFATPPMSGSGTGPWFRSNTSAPTGFNTNSWRDDFSFTQGFPTQLVYTNRPEGSTQLRGNQHIAITNFSFEAPC